MEGRDSSNPPKSPPLKSSQIPLCQTRPNGKNGKNRALYLFLPSIAHAATTAALSFLAPPASPALPRGLADKASPCEFRPFFSRISSSLSYFIHPMENEYVYNTKRSIDSRCTHRSLVLVSTVVTVVVVVTLLRSRFTERAWRSRRCRPRPIRRDLWRREP